MAAPGSQPPDDSDPHCVCSKPADEPPEVFAQSQGVVREDSTPSDHQGLVLARESSSSSDQQHAETVELPAEFRLVHRPLTVSSQGTQSCCGGSTGCGAETVDGLFSQRTYSSFPATRQSSGAPLACSFGVVQADSSSDSVYLVDMDKNGAQVGMNRDGSLCITDKGELFQKIDKGDKTTGSGDVFEIFALRSSTNSNYFLAVDTHSFQVKGMTKGDMTDPSNCYWRMQGFSRIGKPKGPTDFALQYWGAGFGPFNPNTTDGYYFVIEIQPPEPPVFVIADKSKAAVYGCFSYRRP